MVHYCREVISCISSDQNKAFLSDFDRKNSHPDKILQESIENVEMVLGLLTHLLQKESINGLSMKEIMNKNSTGQLVIDIISLGGNNYKQYTRNARTLLDGALHCGIELLYGGRNASCQKIIYQYVVNPSRGKNFFESVQRFSNVPKSSIVELAGGSYRQNSAIIRDDLKQLTHLMHFLQLLCEGHYHDMQSLIFSRVRFLEDCVTLFQDLVTISLSNQFLLINALVIMRILDFFTEVVQGPCLKNQNLLLKNENFILSLEHLSSFYLPSSSIQWDDIPLQCLQFEVLQNSRNSVQKALQTKYSRLLNFAELKGIKSRILLLQLSLLEGRQLAPSDIGSFLARIIREK